MLADIHKLKPVRADVVREAGGRKVRSAHTTLTHLTPPPTPQNECVKLTRKNEGLHPMDAGGETSLEALARRADCGLFALATHTKKRPHALTLGRFFDGRLLDAVEMTLGAVTTVAEAGAAAAAARVAVGHKPLLFFAGAPFEPAGGDPAMVAAKSLLLDVFRGRVVQAINLAVSVLCVCGMVEEGGQGFFFCRNTYKHPTTPQGIDRIIVVLAPSGRRLLVRHYAVALKKSGGRVPRVELTQIGPSWDATVTRHRAAPPDLEKAALKKVEGLDKKKVRECGGVGGVFFYLPCAARATTRHKHNPFHF